MRKVVGFCIVFLLGNLLVSGVGYGQINNCLRLICVNGQYDSLRMATCANPDSVKVDTCSGSATHNESFSKKWFYIKFTYYAISLPQVPFDSDLEVPWTAINTAYSKLRASFANLESKYGVLHLRKYAPNAIDSTDGGSKIYYLRFDVYACVDSVLQDLSTILELAEYNFSSYPGWLLKVPNKSTTLHTLSIQPNPAYSNLIIKRTDGYPLHRIIVFDANGRMVLERSGEFQPEITLDIRSLSSGRYMVLCDDSLEEPFIVAK